jgi:NAD(P)H-binding
VTARKALASPALIFASAQAVVSKANLAPARLLAPSAPDDRRLDPHPDDNARIHDSPAFRQSGAPFASTCGRHRRRRGLGQGFLRVCRAKLIGFTAIVRSRPERVTNLPSACRVATVASLADKSALTNAFAGADAVLSAVGLTATSSDSSALLSVNMPTVEAVMNAAGADRIVLINTLIASLPGKPASRAMRFFAWMPGKMGRGACELQAMVDAPGQVAFSSLRWTLVRAGVNSRGKNEPPAVSADWEGALNSWSPVAYASMGRWMLDEAAAGEFVRAAPLVSRRRQASTT